MPSPQQFFKIFNLQAIWTSCLFVQIWDEKKYGLAGLSQRKRIPLYDKFEKCVILGESLKSPRCPSSDTRDTTVERTCGSSQTDWELWVLKTPAIFIPPSEEGKPTGNHTVLGILRHGFNSSSATVFPCGLVCITYLLCASVPIYKMMLTKHGDAGKNSIKSEGYSGTLETRTV